MANNSDSSDLSSIDSLLDEAELEGSIEEETVIVDELAADSLQDNKTEEKPVTKLDEKVELESTSTPLASQKKQDRVITDDKTDEILKKRSVVRKDQLKNQSSAGETKKMKKLIIIFSSVIIVLLLIILISSIWLSLLPSGLDEKSLVKIANIETSIKETELDAKSSSIALKEIDKKLNALSFQVNQMDIDLLELSSLKKTHKPLLNLTADSKVDKKETSKVDKSKLSSNANLKITNKIDKVSSQMTIAQRRIYEVNNRIKSFQTQYKVLLRSIKNIEKQMLQKELKAAKERHRVQKELKNKNIAKENKSRYQYTDPGGMFEANQEYYR